MNNIDTALNRNARAITDAFKGEKSATATAIREIAEIIEEANGTNSVEGLSIVTSLTGQVLQAKYDGRLGDAHSKAGDLLKVANELATIPVPNVGSFSFLVEFHDPENLGSGLHEGMAGKYEIQPGYKNNGQPFALNETGWILIIAPWMEIWPPDGFEEPGPFYAGIDLGDNGMIIMDDMWASWPDGDGTITLVEN